MISLRAQPTIVDFPSEQNGLWKFAFEVESAGVYSLTGRLDDLGALLNECEGIPMILHLNETSVTIPSLITHGADQNIWFEAINI